MIFHLYIYISKNIKFQSTSKDYFLSSPLSYCVISYLFIFLHVDGTNVGDETVIFIVQ